MLSRWITKSQIHFEHSHFALVRALLYLWLFFLHIVLGLEHVFAVLFFPSSHSFRHLYPLQQNGTYTTSYSSHCRLQRSFRFSTVAYSLALATTILFVYVAFDIIDPAEYATVVRAATLTVNTNADDNDGSCAAAPGDCTLREAINAAGPNDTIQFSTGMSIELTSALPLLNDNNLTVDGTVSSSNLVNINCKDTANAALIISGDNVTVKNLVVRDCRFHGIRVDENADSFVIDGVRTTSNDMGGLSIAAGTGGVIRKTIVDSNLGLGIFVLERDSLTIDGNDINNNTGNGINGSQLTNSRIVNNTIRANGNHGIYLKNTSGTTIANNIIGATRTYEVSGNAVDGINLEESSQNAIDANTIVGNTINGIALLTSSNSNTITGNSIGYSTNISGFFAENGAGGITIRGSNNIIGASLSQNFASNTISSSESGIAFRGSSATGNIHRNNTFYGPSDPVVVVDGAQSGITAPIITAWFNDSVYGTAQGGVTIDVYGAGEDQPFLILGSTTADSNGDWLFSSDAVSDQGDGLGIVASASDVGSSVMARTTEQTPLSISSVTINPGGTTAILSWLTNLAATSTVIYEREGVAGVNTTVTDEIAVTNHTVTLIDLQPGTEYRCTITSQDAQIEDNVANYTSCAFTTSGDITPPVLSSVGATDIAAESAIVTWTTDEAATSQVEYGTTDSYGESVSSSELTINHNLTLANLSPETTYHFRVISVDAAENSASSEDVTFTTIEALSYADEVASIVEISDSLDQITIVSGDNLDDITLPFGDLTFTFTDSKRRFTENRLHFVLALVKKKQEAIVERKKVFDEQGKAAIKVKQELLEREKKYVVSTGIVNKDDAYVNDTGLAERFTFTLKDIPQLLVPATTISYRMPEKFVVASKAPSVTVTLKKTSEEEIFHCTAEITDGIGECAPPFGVSVGQYLLTLTDARGGTITTDFIISDIAANGILTTDRRDKKFYNRIIYEGQPTLTGLTTTGHSVELSVPQIDGAMLATADITSGTTATWKFTLKLTTLPIGVTEFRIVDRMQDGTVANEYTYPVFRTYKPVMPTVNEPKDNQTFTTAPTIQIIGPNDHIVQLFDSSGRLLSEAQYADGARHFDLSEWFTKVGTYTLALRNRNSLGLPSKNVSFTFTLKKASIGFVTTPTEKVEEPIEEVTEESTEKVVEPLKIELGNVTAESARATIPFTTSLFSNCTLQYGTAALMRDESLSESPTVLMQNHSFTLLNLTPATTYHYIVLCTADGETATTADATFTTAVSETVDSDDDGLSDTFETIIQKETVTDSDGDGISDELEETYKLDPTKSDSDGDTISDGEEVQIGMDPSNLDSDGDGTNDDQELPPSTDPSIVDTDGDGLSDRDEDILGCDPTLADTDGDGLSDHIEALLGTSCTASDSDEDEVADDVDSELDTAIALPDLVELESRTQEVADAAFQTTGATQPTDYPLLTTERIRLTEPQKDAITRVLSEDVATTTLQVIPDETTSVTPGEITVITRQRILDVSRWFAQKQSEEKTTIVLSGKINLPSSPLVPYHVTQEPLYLLVTFFSAPVVKIAQVDADGYWTMTLPAELFAAGEHTAYAAAEVNGTRGEQVEIAKIVIQEKKSLSNTTWLVLINIVIAAFAIAVALILQRKHKEQMQK